MDELKAIVKALDIKFEQVFTLPDGKEIKTGPGHGDQLILHPSEDTRLHWTREYLERAKQAYAEAIMQNEVFHSNTSLHQDDKDSYDAAAKNY